jgi:hypothetical protein
LGLGLEGIVDAKRYMKSGAGLARRTGAYFFWKGLVAYFCLKDVVKYKKLLILDGDDYEYCKRHY